MTHGGLQTEGEIDPLFGWQESLWEAKRPSQAGC